MSAGQVPKYTSSPNSYLCRCIPNRSSQPAYAVLAIIAILLQGVLKFPLPAPHLPVNNLNSTGLCYEAEEVRQCIRSGKTESEIMPLVHTQMVANIMDTVMKQLGRIT